MKKKLAIAFILAAVSGTAQANVILDGILGDGVGYTNSETVNWFNGHQTANSIYGDFNSQFATTTISYGLSELAGDSSGTQFFFLFVEAPLFAKNMIWQDLDWRSDFPVTNTDPSSGLTEDDAASYRVHHETHHDPGTMKLDFRGATGSEKVVFVDANGSKMFEADLDGVADNAFGLVGFKDSVDYLFDNNISTEALSLARDTTMSFEFMFEIDSTANAAILAIVRNGIEFHLSPERGLVPTPASAALLGLGGLTLLRRRRPGS